MVTSNDVKRPSPREPCSANEMLGSMTPRSDDEDRLHPSLEIAPQHWRSLQVLFSSVTKKMHPSSASSASTASDESKEHDAHDGSDGTDASAGCDGNCRPCLFFFKKKGCNRQPCNFCHAEIHRLRTEEYQRARTERYFAEKSTKKIASGEAIR
ncbi:unnamed protein product [Symbiodinium necroappetens]|uniref:C3H1-type domain-containing protein n=1 Tax=Symbiodinium necroappetens TaxID=1628268 RepID=A0A812PJ12_9DINO|nr:unnamed protein product [Symbiodinium necroappetens]